MTSVESKSMDRPDETHTPTKLTANVVHLGTATVKRLTAEPGFRWSDCIRGSSILTGQPEVGPVRRA
jgi:hypothetical protein